MKEKFIKSTIILVLGGILTKILSLVIRIITTRIVGTYGIGLFMLIAPTYNLFITISSFSLSIAISKLVSENKRNNKKLILNILPVAIIFNIIIIIILLISSKFIAVSLLKNKYLYYPILSIMFTIPFVTISSIIKGYFYGKENMLPSVISSLIEQISRIIIIILISPYLLDKGLIYAISGLVIFNGISEIISIIVLILFLPKHAKIKKSDLRIDKTNIKDIFGIALPNTSSRLLTSIGIFLEPIIITFVLLKIGKTNDFITREYGIISGYVLPIVTLPSFISYSVSTALLPVISKYNEQRNYIAIKRKLKQAIMFCLVLGIFTSIILILFPNFFMKLLFKQAIGINYLKLASILYILFYVQAPIISFFQGTNNSKIVFYITLIGIIVKNISLFCLTFLDINLYSILISDFIKSLVITIYSYIKIKKLL